MRQLVFLERFCLIGHLVTMLFGWAGLILIVPHPEMIENLGEFGQQVFQMSMKNGGMINIVLGTVAVALYAYRTLGLRHWLTFMVPATILSLSSELAGTSSGFPFGDYHYLDGLGFKIAGLVPFTIPLSWFYMGLAAYLIASSGLQVRQKLSLGRTVAAVAIAALLFTCWDFALEPAMSQTMVPFWFWEQPGAFYGTPYQNYAGWYGTSASFVTVAALLWGKEQISLTKQELSFPLIIYISNYVYAAGLSLAAGYWFPVCLGAVVGVIPVLLLWQSAQAAKVPTLETTSLKEITVAPVEVAAK